MVRLAIHPRLSLCTPRFLQVFIVVCCGLVCYPFVTVSDTTDPDSILQRMGSAYDGIRNTIERIMREYQQGRAQGQRELHLRGHDCVDGRSAYHLELTYPDTKTAGYYAYRGEIWIDKEYYLPTKLLIYDWDN